MSPEGVQGPGEPSHDPTANAQEKPTPGSDGSTVVAAQVISPYFECPSHEDMGQAPTATACQDCAGGRRKGLAGPPSSVASGLRRDTGWAAGVWGEWWSGEA